MADNDPARGSTAMQAAENIQKERRVIQVLSGAAIELGSLGLRSFATTSLPGALARLRV